MYQINVSKSNFIKIKDKLEICPFSDVLSEIKTGTYKRQIEMIQSEQDHNIRNKMKVKYLPCFIPTGEFTSMRDTDNVSFNGIVCADIDEIKDIQALKELLIGQESLLALMKSPSGNLKAFIQTDLQDKDKYKETYRYVGREYNLLGNPEFKYDTACSNLSHPCFYSSDPDLYINWNAKPLHIDIANLPVINNVVKEKEKEIKPDNDEVIGMPLLTEWTDIKNAIISEHELFEKFFPMFPGTRNNNIYKLASFMSLEGIPKNYAKNYIVAYYTDKENGLSSIEIKLAIDSAYGNYEKPYTS